MRKVEFEDIGLVSYGKAWDFQTEIFTKTVDLKLANRKNPERATETKDHFLFVEHPPVFTLGKSGKKEHLLVDEEQLKKDGFEYFPVNRGGDITYHGPGQLVGYPILDLDQFYTDIGKYMRMLEEAIIRTCADYGLEASRIEGLTGVWVDADQGLKARKIAALGVKCSRWVTMHGFAFNLNTDLDFFNLIVPCGINDRGVTSLAKESGRAIDEAEAANRLKTHLTDLFDWNLTSADQNR